MQKAISNKIQLGETLNCLDDYGGVPSINDEGTLENLIGKVDKVRSFMKTDKAEGDLSRYFPDILPIQALHTNACLPCLHTLPMQALHTQIKNIEFILDLTANTYSNFSTMEICLPLKFTKKSNEALQMEAQMITVNIFLDIGLLILI